jgi:hypothetical protein
MLSTGLSYPQQAKSYPHLFAEKQRSYPQTKGLPLCRLNRFKGTSERSFAF